MARTKQTERLLNKEKHHHQSLTNQKIARKSAPVTTGVKNSFLQKGGVKNMDAYKPDSEERIFPSKTKFIKKMALPTRKRLERVVIPRKSAPVRFLPLGKHNRILRQLKNTLRQPKSKILVINGKKYYLSFDIIIWTQPLLVQPQNLIGGHLLPQLRSNIGHQITIRRFTAQNGVDLFVSLIPKVNVDQFQMPTLYNYHILRRNCIFTCFLSIYIDYNTVDACHYITNPNEGLYDIDLFPFDYKETERHSEQNLSSNEENSSQSSSSEVGQDQSSRSSSSEVGQDQSSRSSSSEVGQDQSSRSSSSEVGQGQSSSISSSQTIVRHIQESESIQSEESSIIYLSSSQQGPIFGQLNQELKIDLEISQPFIPSLESQLISFVNRLQPTQDLDLHQIQDQYEQGFISGYHQGTIHMINEWGRFRFEDIPNPYTMINGELSNECEKILMDINQLTPFNLILDLRIRNEFIRRMLLFRFANPQTKSRFIKCMRDNICADPEDLAFAIISLPPIQIIDLAFHHILQFISSFTMKQIAWEFISSGYGITKLVMLSTQHAGLLFLRNKNLGKNGLISELNQQISSFEELVRGPIILNEH